MDPEDAVKEVKEAIARGIDECIEQGILKEFLEQNRSDVIEMMFNQIIIEKALELEEKEAEEKEKSEQATAEQESSLDSKRTADSGESQV